MNSDPVNSKTQVGNKQSKSLTVTLNDILEQSKQLIDVKKYEQPTSTLTITLLKSIGEANTYVWFYIAHRNISITPEDYYQYQ